MVEQRQGGATTLSSPGINQNLGDTGAYTFHDFWVGADSSWDTVKVNVGTGNLFIRGKMAELPGPGVPAVAYRVYNSQNDTSTGYLGRYWHADYELTGLFVQTSEVTFFDGTGAKWRFTSAAGGRWNSPAGSNASLSKSSDGSWVISYNRTGEKLTFNASGWPVKRTDRNGTGITYGYQGDRVVSVTDAVGKRLTMEYYPFGSTYILDTVGGYGRFTTLNYNPQRMLTESNPLSRDRQTVAYDSAFRPSRLAVGGLALAFEYDTHHRVIKVTQSRSGETSLVTRFAYADGRTTVTDPRGNTSVYEVDDQWRVASVTDQLGRERGQTWTPNSDVETVTDASGGTGNVSRATYDQLNNQTSIVLPTGAATRALYAQGPDCQTAQSGHPYLPKCAIDAQGSRQSYTYDSAGNVTRVEDATTGGTAARFSYTYENAAGSVCGGVTGQVCTATDGNGRVTRYSYSAGNLTKVTPPSPLGATTYAYDAVGRATAVTDGRGHTTRYAYDAADRITRTTFHNGQTLTTVYNANGTVASETDSAGGRITYAYNLAGKQTRQQVQAPSSGGISGTVTMGYDAAGNLTTYSDGTGTTRYSYDKANQLTQLTEPGGSCPATGNPAANSGCIKFAYDRNGNETRRDLPGGARVITFRDASGRTTRIWALDRSSSTQVDIGYSYTGAGADRTLLQSRTSTREEGIAAGAVTTYTYDSLQRLTRAVERTGSTVRATFAYAYDKAGNRTSQTQTGAVGVARAGTISYAYNAANQITSTSADAGTWAYDKAGNETRNGARGWTSTFGDRGQLTALATRTYTTFGLGNERTFRAGAVDFLLSPLGVTREKTGTVTTRTTRTPDGKVAATHGAISEYFVTDHLGSVVGLFSPSGTWTGGYSYTPYGERRFAGPGTSANNWRYIGSDEELASFYNLSARHYDATIGRFTQMDPTGQEPNPYTYAQANPCNNVDPTGTVTACAAAASIFGLTSFAAGSIAFAAIAISNPVTALLVAGTAGVVSFSTGAPAAILSGYVLFGGEC